MKIKQTIKTGLQLDIKWVRAMLTISGVAMLVIFFIPVFSPKDAQPIVMQMEQAVDSLGVADSMVSDSLNEKLMVVSNPVSQAPIQIQIIQESKPFDWKGTITWIIGAMNGIVLIVLNVKNMFKKP